MEGKKLGLVGRVFLGGLALLGGAKLVNGAVTGRLDMEVNINNLNYVNNTWKFLHKDTTTDGFDSGEDNTYGTIFFPFSTASKAISKIPGYELMTDKRHPDSNTPIDLELSLHSESGDPIYVNSSNNYLEFILDPTERDWEFGNKPITYWEQDENDPSIFYLIANVRKEILQNNGVIPLPNLDGTYDSEEPYLKSQIRFDTHFVHLNNKDFSNLENYAVFANAYGRTGITDANRADVNDPGAWADYNLDGNVDVNDLGIFSDYYLTSRKYHLEDGWIVE